MGMDTTKDKTGHCSAEVGAVGGKPVFHPHSCKILYNNILLKNTLLRNQICVPVVYRRIKYKYELRAYELNHESAITSDINYAQWWRTSTFILFCDTSRVHMFHFDSNTARPSVSL